MSLIKAGYYSGAGDPGRTYDITSDGQRFLMIKTGGVDQTAAPPSLIVVQNWFEELRRLLPAN
jgi:hypothetical protein